MTNSISTELDAVNVIIGTIGEPPLSSLNEDIPNDAALALTVLNEVSREVQTRGWYWNTDSGYPLPRDQNGRVAIADNVLHVDLSPTTQVDPIRRGSALYDRKNFTYTFTADLTADRIVWFLPFDQLPEAARRYLAIRASAVFQNRYLGSAQMTQIGQADEARAWAILLQDELRVQRPTMLDGAAARILAR